MPDLKPDTFENSFAHSEVAGMWYNTSPKNLKIKVNFVPYEVFNQNINTPETEPTLTPELRMRVTFFIFLLFILFLLSCSYYYIFITSALFFKNW